MLYMFYTYVASVSSSVAYVLQWLHMLFPRVSDVCCKYFNYFRRVLQMFPLDVAKVDLVLHMLQWTPSAAAGPTYMCMGVERVQAAGMGNRASTDQDRAAQDMVWVRDTEWHGLPREAGTGMRRGRRSDASPHPDVGALAFTLE